MTEPVDFATTSRFAVKARAGCGCTTPRPGLHWAQLEKFDEFNRLVIGFLEGGS